MPNHKINWVNDHTQICDRLDERVQLMQNYLDSKPDDFDGIDVKRFLLGQAREQVTWYRQSIEGLDFVEAVMLVKLQTTNYLIYAELDKAERITHLTLKNRIPVQTCYAIVYEIEARGDYEVSWGTADEGYSDTVRVSRTTVERKLNWGELVSTQDVPLKCFLGHFRKDFLGGSA